jgi:hypothetical protein
MRDDELDARVRGLLLALPQPSAPTVPARQLRARGRARTRRRRLALVTATAALAAGAGWNAAEGRDAGPSAHHADARPAAAPPTRTWPAAGHAALDAARATVVAYYTRLPQVSGAAGDAERKALERAHLADSALAQASASPRSLGGPARTWPAVCGNPAAPLRVGPLRQTGPDRATASVSGTPGPGSTVITVSLTTGLITAWTCA